MDPDLDPYPDQNWAKFWIHIQIQCIWIQNTTLPHTQLFDQTLHSADLVHVLEGADRPKLLVVHSVLLRAGVDLEQPDDSQAGVQPISWHPGGGAAFRNQELK